jgi:hypothetical protein
MDIEDEATP